MVEMVDEMVEEGAGGQLDRRLRALVPQQRHGHVLQQFARGGPRLRLFSKDSVKKFRGELSHRS